MEITDKRVLRELRIARNGTLSENIATRPENERDGRTDMEILLEEACDLLDMYDEGDTCFSEALEDARDILRETKNGKEIPLNSKTLKPKYPPYKINDAKEIVNEYRRLNNLVKRLWKY